MKQAIRFNFSYEAEEITLASARRLTKCTPAGDSDPQCDLSEKGSGNWFELRDAKDRVVYRRLSNAFIPREIEVRSWDGMHPARRIKGQFKSGTFSLLVPVVEGAKKLVLIERLPDDSGKEIKTIEHVVIHLAKIKYQQ